MPHAMVRMLLKNSLAISMASSYLAADTRRFGILLELVDKLILTICSIGLVSSLETNLISR